MSATRLLLLGLLLFGLSALAVGQERATRIKQPDPCDPRALLPPTDPAYVEAMDLARTLNTHGLPVRCVMLSKEAQMFDGQLGAAFFRTAMGDFDALFLPRSQNWDGLKVVEQRQPDGYTRYHFDGAPRYSGTWEGKSVYFVQHRNQLLHSLNQQLVAKLRGALGQ
jgi:hypothetical protein